LFGTDGSDPADRALGYLLDAHDPENTSILVTSVARTPELILSYGGSSGYEAEMLGRSNVEIREELKEESYKITSDAINRLQQTGFDCEQVVPLGRPGEEIVNVAESEDVDGIVMGRRGRGRIGELFLGSVSHYVVHHAECPVTLVPFSGDES
jgi:nucleotide-binding universal stress UspA family protein